MASLPTTNITPAVLLLGGSFNPTHFGHVEILTACRDYLENTHSYKVVAAFCVITTDGYVQSKVKKEALTFSHRYQLCEATIKDFFASKLKSQVDQPSEERIWIFPSHKPCGSAASYHNPSFEKLHTNATRIVVMGADKILTKSKTPKWGKYANSASKGTRNYLTLCVGRKGYSEDVLEKYNKDIKQGVIDNKVFIYVDLNVRNISSTQIREVLWKYIEDVERQTANQSVQNNELENTSTELRLTKEFVGVTLVPQMGQNAFDHWMKNYKTMWTDLVSDNS